MPVAAQLSNAEMEAARKQISDYAGWFVGIGAMLILLGMVAITFPLLSTIAAAIWIAWMLVIGGVLMIVHAAVAWRWPDSAGAILIGLLYLGAGASLLYAPLAGIVSLTIVMAVLFVVEGVAEMVTAFRLRPLNGWGWLLFSGLAAVGTGVLIAYALPISAAWALGLLFGLNLLSTGLSFVLLALACRQGATQDVGRGFGRTGLKAS
jgi:uncharacterized membrane protein HdeD (DUF308 family)